MRRWLIAVFALHFFLSVGAFAFGHGHPAAPSQLSAVQGLVEAATPADSPKQASPAQDHGLTDTQPDLPECLDVLMAAATRGESLRTPPPPSAKDLTPPTLDGPQRPPRGLPIRA